MPATKTVKVRMLGNFRDYEVGKDYDLPVELANQLTGIGYARLVDEKAPAVEEE
jgi:hypothetical protein